MTVFNLPTPRATRYPELAYRNDMRGLWRIIDTGTGNAVGPHYHTKAELLADLDRYARFFGCADAPEAIEGSNPTIKSGYAFTHSGADWEHSSDEDWPTECLGERAINGSAIVGCRFIDGNKCNVFRLADGTYAAQLELYGF